MTHQEFFDWLVDEEINGRISPQQREELMNQKNRFESDRAYIEANFPGRVVGYAGNQRFDGDSVHDLLENVQRTQPHRLTYFEPIGFDLF
jgi:hypothetical protein